MPKALRGRRSPARGPDVGHSGALIGERVACLRLMPLAGLVVGHQPGLVEHLTIVFGALAVNWFSKVETSETSVNSSNVRRCRIIATQARSVHTTTTVAGPTRLSHTSEPARQLRSTSGRSSRSPRGTHHSPPGKTRQGTRVASAASRFRRPTRRVRSWNRPVEPMPAVLVATEVISGPPGGAVTPLTTIVDGSPLVQRGSGLTRHRTDLRANTVFLTLVVHHS